MQLSGTTMLNNLEYRHSDIPIIEEYKVPYQKLE